MRPKARFERDVTCIAPKMERTFLLFIALAAGTQAGPIQEIAVGQQCAKQCSLSSKFKYEAGTTYEFNYENEIRTSVQGAAEDHAGLAMTATVNIDFISKCEAVMRLTDVVMKEHDPESSQMKVVSADLKSLLENDPLGFSFQDGTIEQLCLADDLDVKVLNIKRGILSMFQNNMDDISQPKTVQESDVAGTCDTEYTSEDKGWYNVVVKKSKHMLSCTNRHDAQTSLNGMPYDSKSKIQSLPIVKSTHNCEQEIVKESGRLVSVSCKEQHTFAPFSRNDAGANTVNTQDLTFVKQTKTRSQPVAATKVTGLHFDHSTSDTPTNTLQDLNNQLQEVCETTTNGVQHETPKLFTSLIYTMKKMKASEIATAFQQIKSKKICMKNNERVRKFFLDAIPMTGTPASLKMMTQMLVNDDVTGLEAEMWLTTLAFIQKPTVDMLAEVKPLLTMKSNQEKAMMAVSSLVHSLCGNDPDCENYMDVRKIISLLENKIATSCKVTPKNMQTTLIALRAIGNAGYGTSAIKSLQKCIMQSSNPIEIRLSAIEAFRRIPCNADKSAVMSVFTNMDEDSEVRIAAYKSLMECPSSDILKKVKVMLSREEVNQVGSYVWSHLTNLMETSDPHKQTIRAILQDETLRKEFDMDKRKFSRNYEGSFFMERLNTGAAVESDLIWSSKSFIPRSAMLNLTVDLFGNAVNLFEVGGRLEGLEYFLEQYFGPNGYFSENDVQAAVDESAVQTIKTDKAHRINKRMRNVMDDLRGSLYMRVFGNELRYMNFEGIDSLLQSNSFNILDMLINLSKDNEYQYSHSSMFMDSSLMIPTYSGFPMNLTVNGIATIDLKASGKVDIMKMASRPRGMDVHGTLKPSAALEVTSTMSVDALVTKVGLKMVSSLYTSTTVQGKVSLEDGSILDMQFDLPEEKMEVINVKSSFFTVHRDLEREQKMITENKRSNTVCSGDKLAKISGLELCGEVSYPNASLVENAPYFPLTGPVSASVILYKRDTLTGYKLEARSTHTADSNIVRLAFSTPKSKKDRDFGVNFNLNRNDGTLDLSFDSPMKRANFAGNYHYTKNSVGLSGKLNVDNSYRYEVKLGVDAEKSGPGMLYTPTLVVEMPGKTLVDFRSTLKYAPWKIFDLDMTLGGIVKPPMKAQVSFLKKLKLTSVSMSAEISKKQKYTFDASYQTIQFKKKVTYKPQISVRTPSAEVLAFGGSFTNIFGKTIKIDATLDKLTTKPIVLKKAIFGMKQYSRGRKLYNTNLDFRSAPMDLKMRGKFDNRNMKQLATDIDLTYVIRKVARDNIKFASKIINFSNKALTKLRLPMSLTSKLNSDYNMKMLANLDHSKKHSQIDAEISYGPNAKDANKQISLLVSLDKAIRNWSKASAEFNAQFRKGNDLRIVSKLQHQHNPKSLDSSINLRLNKNAMTAALSLKDQSTTLTNFQGTFDLSIPGKTISVSQSLAETKPSEFTSTMTARMGKMQNKIETSWKKVSPSALTLNAKIDLYKVEPMSIQGDYNFSPNMLKSSGTLSKGSDKYSISSISKMTSDDVFETTADIQYPSRRVIASFEQRKEDDVYTSLADLRWNADKDDSQRAVIKSKGKFAGLNNFEESFTIQYPSRNIAFNVKHFFGKKCVSHVDMQWEPNQIYAIDTVFGQYGKDGIDEIEGQLKLATPFKNLKAVTVTVNQQIQASELKTKLDVEWNPKNLISTTFTLSRPVSLKYFNAEVVAKTPFKSFKTAQASLRHRIKGGLSTVGKASWNKQSVQFDVSLDDASNNSKTNMKGEVNIKTTFKTLKTATLNVIHLKDGNKMQTSLTAIRNKKEYGVSSSLKHSLNGWNVNNNGEIKIYSPSEAIQATWDHVNTLNDITSSADITWGKNKNINIKYSGLQNFKGTSGSLSSALAVKSSFNYLSDVVAQISHEHRPGQIDTSMTLTNEGTKVGSAECKYLRQDGNAKFSLVISNPWSASDASLSLTSAYDAMPKTLHMDIRMSPQIAVSVDGSFSQDNRTNMESRLTASSPLFSDITIEGSRKVTANGIKSVASLEYAQGKPIRIQSLHSLNDDKFVKLKVQSPYTKDYSAEIGVRGNMDNFEARIEAEPFLKKWTAAGSFDGRTGLNLRVNTPFPEVPYSQISIKSERVKGDRTSSLTVEYMPGQVFSFVSTYNFENARNLKLSCGLETPFKDFQKSMFEFTHRGPAERFANHILLEYQPGRTVSADTSLSLVNGIEASMVIASPWTDPIQCLLKSNAKFNDLTTHGEFTWKRTHSFDVRNKGSLSAFSTALKVTNGDNIVSGNIDFSKGLKTTTDISIRTPFKQWKSIKVAHSLEGNFNQFNNHLELFATKIGTYTSDLSIDSTAGINIEIEMQTPIQGYRKMKASLSHTGTLEKFNTRVEIISGEKKFTGDIKLATKPAINFVISLKSPIKEYTFTQITFTHDGSSVDFKSNLELQLNKDISEIDISYNYIKKLNVDVAIRSPLFDAVKILIDHWGKPTKFTSKIRARAGKQKLSTDVQFQMNPSLNAQIAIKTPFAYLKNQQLSIKHAGSVNSFKCNMMYRCNGKIFTGDATFQNLDSIKGEVNLKGPSFKPINIAMDATQAPASFKSSLQVSLGKKVVKAEANLDTKSGVNGNVGFSTPFEGFESITASISHNGPISSFKTRGDMSCNRKSASVVVSFDNTRDITASIEVATPFKQYRSMSSSLRHIGGMNDFDTTAQFKVNNKAIDFRAAAQNENVLTMTTSVLSKFSNIPNMDASLNFKDILNTRADVHIGQEKLDFEVAFNTLSDGYNGKVSTAVPWIERVMAEFNHQMTDDSVITEIQATHAGVTKFRVMSDIQRKMPLGITVTVNTPIENYEISTIKLVYSNVQNSLTGEAYLTLNQETHEGRLYVSKTPNFDGSMSVRSPLMKDVDVAVSADGSLRNFRTQMNTKYDGNSLVRSEFDIRFDGPIAGDLKIISPIMKNIKASFHHEGTLQNFKSGALVTYAGQKSEVMVAMNVLGELELNMKLSTPITKDLDVSMTGRGHILNSVITGDIMYGGKSKANINANMDLEGPIDAQITLRTPFSGFSQMSASLNHQGHMSDFRTTTELSLEDSTLSVEASFNPSSGNLLVKSPISEDLKMSFTNNGKFPSSQSQANVMYGSRSLLDASLKLRLPTEGEVMISSPLLNDKPMTAQFKTKENTNGIDVHAKINLNGEKHETDFSIDMSGKCSVSLNSPWTVPVNLVLSYEKKPFTLSTQGELAIGSDRHQYDVMANIANGFQGSILLRSSLMPELRISCNTNNDVTNLKANAELSYSNKDIIEITIDTESSEKLAGIVNVKALGNTVHVGMSATGNSPMNLEANADLTYNGQDIIEIAIKTESEDTLAGSIYAKALGNAINLKMTMNGNTIMNLKTNADLTYNNQDIFDITVETVTDDNLAGSVKAKVLGNTINLALSANGNSYNGFNGHISMSVNEHSVEGDASFNNNRNTQGQVNFKSSFTRPVSAALNYGTNRGTYTSSGNVIVESAKHEYSIELNTKNQMQTKLEITSPLINPIRGSASFNGIMRDFTFNSTMKYGTSKASLSVALNVNSAIRGNIDIVTPFTQPMSASFEHTGHPSNCQSVAKSSYGDDTLFDADLTLSQSPLQVKLLLQTIVPGYENIAASFKHTGEMLAFTNHAELDISGEKTELDISFNAVSKLEGRVLAMSPYFPSFGSGFELTGNMKKFEFSADASVESNTYSIDLLLDTTSDIQSSFTLQSPIKGYRKITGKITHVGILPNIVSSVELKSGRRNLALGSLQMSTKNGYSAKMSLQSILTPTIQMNLGQKGSINNFESVADIRFNGQSSTLNIDFHTSPSMEGSYTLSTPWAASSGKFNIDLKQNGIEMTAESRLDEKLMSIGMAYQGGNNMGLTFTLQTPFETLNYLKGTANFNTRYNGFSGQAELELPSRKSIELVAQLRGLTGSMVLKTPFDGLKYSAINTKYNGQFPNIVTGMTLNLLNQRYAIDAKLDGLNGNLEISTPIEGFENTVVSFNKQGPVTDMQAALRVSIMNKDISVSVENKMSGSRLETKARLETPETEDLVFELSHYGNKFDFVNSVMLSMGPANTLSSSTTFKLRNTNLDVESTLSTTFTGYSDEQKLKLSLDESFPNYKTSMFAKLMGSEYSIMSSLDTTTSINGKFALTTPFKSLRDISVDIEHTGTGRRFETKSSIGINSERMSSEFTFMKYGWRRLQTSLDVQTSFGGMENTKISYRHTASIDSFECNSDASIFNQDYTGNIRASKKPMKAKITFTTPFNGFQEIGADVKLDIGSEIYITEANVAYMQDKTISLSSEINFRDSPKLIHMKLSTPFTGYETTEARLTHSGDYRNFQSIATISTPFTPALRTQVNLRSSSMSSFDGRIVFNSQIKHLENIELSLKNEVNLGKYKTNFETSWAPSKTITLTSQLTDYTNSMSADIALTTPFESVKQLSMKTELGVKQNQYSSSIIIKHNLETCVDMGSDIDVTSGNPSAVVILREHTPVRAELSAVYDNTQYSGKFLLNDDLKVEASHEMKMQRTLIKYESALNSVLVKNQMRAGSCKCDLFINNYHYGYDVSITKSEGSLKVILPSRSLKVTGFSNQDKTEGSFMWDADKDESKMVGFKSELTRSADSTKADVTLQMPSLGKNVHIDSEMILNRDKVLFEGKTDFTYSRDSRKTITLTSKLMDISNHWSSKNYSFSLGLEHPYTAIGVQLKSHLGKSRSEYTGGFDLEYLTARRETKSFSVNGEINKLRQSAKLNMDTPLKQISISGDSKMQNPFSVSLVRQFDNKKPMRTAVTLDTQNKKIAFETNYDLDNPSSEFHVSAKYLNSSAILSEVAHVVNRQKVVDALMFLRLNNSHLLHSRLHWRPSALDDLKVLLSKKYNESAKELAQLNKIISNSVREETQMKLSAIKRSFIEEMEPYAELLEEEIEKVVVLYEKNAYHIRDVTDTVISISKTAESQIEAMASEAGENLDILSKMVNEKAESIYITIDDMAKYMVTGIMGKLEPLYNMTQHPSLVSFRNQAHSHYISYMDQLTSLPEKVPTMANTYTSAIYGAGQNMNTRLNSILGRDDVKYVRSYADPVVYQGQNAYKYWEVRENVEMLIDAVVDMVKSEIEKELSDLKASLFSLTKTTFTVYNPAHGEIQADIHLPIPLRSLDQVPVIDVAPYMTKIQQYKEQMPGLPQISTDISTWLPPYDAYATIQGDKVTTFDGVQYDLGASCSFLLARDFVDGNFSLVLHKQDNSKNILLMADGKAITILADGKVLVDDKPVTTPATLKNITITAVDKVLTVVKGADSFEVSYSPMSDLITVKLNGWYFGKTSGLLGTYDNEPSNDFLSSYGRPINNAARFARTWDMSLTKCR